MDQRDPLVQMLADRLAIHDCLVRYCRGVDRLDRELLISVYHADAIDDHGVFVGGPQAVADWIIAYHSRAQTATQHIITNHSCELVGLVAHCETYYMLAAMNVAEAPLALAGGRYIDRFEKREGRWAIAARKVASDWAGAPGESILSPEGRAALNSGANPSRDRNDPSYDRPLIVDAGRIGYEYKW